MTDVICSMSIAHKISISLKASITLSARYYAKVMSLVWNKGYALAYRKYSQDYVERPVCVNHLCQCDKDAYCIGLSARHGAWLGALKSQC